MLRRVLLQKFEILLVQSLPTKFYPDGDKVTISTHVDDLQPTCNQEKLDVERKALEEEFGSLTVQKREYTHVAMEVVRNDKFEITIGQRKFTDALSRIEMAPKRRTQKTDKVTEEELAELCGKVGSLSWLALNTRPDLACITSELQTEVTTPTVEMLIKCNGAIERAKMHKDEKLIYRHLGKDFRIECFCDSAFKSKTEPGRPRYGVAIRLATDDKPDLGGHGNLILWKSSVTKRAVRSTLGAETIAQVNGFDKGCHVRNLLVGTLTRKPANTKIGDHGWMYRAIAMDILTDCDSLWASKQGHKVPLEANLLPDLTTLRQAHANNMIRKSYSIPTGDMVADGLTKDLDD